MKSTTALLISCLFLFLSCKKDPAEDSEKQIKKSNENSFTRIKIDSIAYKKSVGFYQNFLNAYQRNASNPKATLVSIDSMLFYLDKSNCTNQETISTFLINANAMYEFSGEHARGLKWYKTFRKKSLIDSLVNLDLVSKTYYWEAGSECTSKTQIHENPYETLIKPWNSILDSLPQNLNRAYSSDEILNYKSQALYYEIMLAKGFRDFRRLKRITPIYERLVLDHKNIFYTVDIEGYTKTQVHQMYLGNLGHIADIYLQVDPEKALKVIDIMEKNIIYTFDYQMTNQKRFNFYRVTEQYDEVINGYEGYFKKKSNFPNEGVTVNHFDNMIRENYLSVLCKIKAPEKKVLTAFQDTKLNIEKMRQNNYRNLAFSYYSLIEYYQNTKDFKTADSLLNVASTYVLDRELKKREKSLPIYKINQLFNTSKSVNEIKEQIVKYLKINNLNVSSGTDAGRLKETHSIFQVKELTKINEILINDPTNFEKELLLNYKLTTNLVISFLNEGQMLSSERDAILNLKNSILKSIENHNNFKNNKTLLEYLETLNAVELSLKLKIENSIDSNEELRELIAKNDAISRALKNDSLKPAKLNELLNDHKFIKAALEKNSLYQNTLLLDYKLTDYIANLTEGTLVYRFYESNDKIALCKIEKNKKLSWTFVNKDKILRSSKSIENSIANQKNIEPQLKKLKQYFQIKNNAETVILVPSPISNEIPLELLFNTSVRLSRAIDLKEMVQTQSKSQRATSIFNPSYRGFENSIVKRIERSGNVALPFAREESAYISNLFKGDLFKNEKATKNNFIKLAGKYNIHHLAMHAVVEEASDYNAKLLFYGNKEEDHMNLNDIYNLNIDADLVTLSACNTAYGKADPIEGAMSLSRAFQYAGARATLTSLWRVPDRETSIIMKSFYTHLKNGERKDVALKMAQNDYLKNTVEADLKHPYYWAGFILTGDTNPIATATPWWIYSLFIAASLLIILWLSVLFKKKKREAYE